MYAYLKGILVQAESTDVILEVQGVGYFLLIPSRLFQELPPIGHPLQLFTTFVVRELSQTLYGFLTSAERDIFEVLMNVTGIGPKLALSLIGHLTFDELQNAVTHQDIPTLCRVPGVGKKTAERLIVELKDKFPHLPLQACSLMTVGHGTTSLVRDAMQALINLGYNQHSAQKAIKHCLKERPEISDLALLITASLKYF